MTGDKKSSLVIQNLGLIIGAAALVGSLGLNVSLGLDIRNSRTPRMAGVKIGGDLSVIPVVGSQSELHELHLADGKRSILYIMSPTCSWCARNVDNIRYLAEKTQKEYQLIGLSITGDKLAEYRASTPLPFPVLVADASKAPSALDLSATPQTVVVGPKGAVEKAWVGAFDGKTKAEIESFFKVQLPGLIDVKTKGAGH
jgi:hypothetical protein